MTDSGTGPRRSPGGQETGPGARAGDRAGALPAAVFCAFAALLPVVCVLAPKGTVALLLLTALLAVPACWRACGRFPVPDRNGSLALAVLLAWCAVASAWSPDVEGSLILVLRIAAVFAAGMVLFPVAARLDGRARNRIGQCLAAGFTAGLALIAAGIALDYPLLGSFKDEVPENKAVWLNRGAVAMALIVWPLAGWLWTRGLGRAALAVPVLLGIGSLFLESMAATLGFAAGLAAVLLARAHRKGGLAATVAASVAAVAAMPFAARSMHEGGWHRADWLAESARHRVEIWNFSVQHIAEKPLLGWGFDASRHFGAHYPGTGGTGKAAMALHPHNAPLQVMLELGAVGAVIGLALLVWMAVRLHNMPACTGAPAQALFLSALAVGCVAFGLWQNWWLALVVSVALLAPLTAAPPAGDGGAARP